MPEYRFRYEKKGKASYISHLDVLRTFQRAFLRAGVVLKHSEGFNPHPKISIAMPLQLGCESSCECLDASVLTAPEDLLPALNRALPEGIRVLSVGEPRMAVGKIGWSDWELRFADDSTAEKAAELLRKESLPVDKKTKRGMSVLDIAPHMKQLKLEGPILTLRLKSGNPNVNVGDVAKVLTAAPEPLMIQKAKRVQMYDENSEVFA